MPFTRRQYIQAFAAYLAASPLARAQRDLPYTGERMPSLEELVNVFEFEPVCKARLPQQNYDFIAGGVDNEWSVRHNREAFDKITFRPRMMVDTSGMDLSLNLFGSKLSCPILIAPTAGHGLATPEGEFATARAAAKVQTVMALSTNASQQLEKVAAASSFPKWYQLYPGPDLEGTYERTYRAMGAGFKAIVLTVDGPYGSHRERLSRDRIRVAVPSGLGARTAKRRQRPDDEEPVKPPPYGLSPALMNRLDWRFFDDLKKRCNVPVLIKGILTAEDAELARQHGADGIVCSNHGGRYLEYAPATIEVLPEIVGAAGNVPVLVDSGFRRGTDVLKALAIGAKAVLVGRPVLWGLGAYGEAGAVRVLELMRTELALAMGLCGKPNLASINRTLVKF